jgi:hypothetical protein
MRGERSRWRIVARASRTVPDSSPKSITTLASTATRGLAGAVGIVESQKNVVKLLALAVGEIIATLALLRADHCADGRLFNLRFLAFHCCQLRTKHLTGQQPTHRTGPYGRLSGAFHIFGVSFLILILILLLIRAQKGEEIKIKIRSKIERGTQKCDMCHARRQARPDPRLKRTSLTPGTRALACGCRRPRRELPLIPSEVDRRPRCGRRGRRPPHARRVFSPDRGRFIVGRGFVARLASGQTRRDQLKFNRK